MCEAKGEALVCESKVVLLHLSEQTLVELRLHSDIVALLNVYIVNIMFFCTLCS